PSEGSLRAIFDAVVELPVEARAAFLARPDLAPELKVELHALLAADAASDTYLGRAFTGELAPEPGICERFGAYRTLRLLGRGGMGMVFLAERVDGELRHAAAIKVLRHTW